MIAYVDSSVLLRIVLAQTPVLESWSEIERGVASRMVEVECLRTLDRVRLRAIPSEASIVAMHEKLHELMDALEIVELAPASLARAAQPFPTSIGTLDAIHLATALLWRETMDESLVLATHDAGLAQAARAYGFPVAGV